MFLAHKPGLKYVNRAEQSDYDYDKDTLTVDGYWHVLDLSAIVPANAKVVLLRVGVGYDMRGKFIRISKAGQTNVYSCFEVTTQVAGTRFEDTTLVDCTGQQIQYLASAGVPMWLYLIVLGWFL